ncbi:hypothetical protein KSF73_11340 [Burkholderiaceae bacterium DAT-1]|nr:hypothetical protein [Burkholderiaceae bacterium DAT-1]
MKMMSGSYQLTALNPRVFMLIVCMLMLTLWVEKILFSAKNNRPIYILNNAEYDHSIDQAKKDGERNAQALFNNGIRIYYIIANPGPFSGCNNVNLIKLLDKYKIDKVRASFYDFANPEQAFRDSFNDKIIKLTSKSNPEFKSELAQLEKDQHPIYDCTL